VTDWKLVPCGPCGGKSETRVERDGDERRTYEVPVRTGSGAPANVFLRRGLHEGPIRPLDWIALPWWSTVRGRCTFCGGLGMRLVPA